MASSSYTPNIGLCAWNASDKPKRTDFVSDNTKIDSVLGGHINNNDIHVTAKQKEIFSNPIVVTGYAGTGTATRTITLEFAPKLAIVFQRECPPVTTDSGSNYINHFAVAAAVGGSMSSVTLNQNKLTVTQDSSPTDSVKNNFNEEYVQYTVVLFR